MKITDVRVYPVEGNTSVKANVSVTIDDAVVIYVKLINGKNGYFLSMPNHSYEDENGERIYKDDVYFLSRDYYDEVLDRIVEKLEKPSKGRRTKK